MKNARHYAKLDSQFWVGDTGKHLRGTGKEAQLVAVYLLSSPHANMLGLYYMPLVYIAHETGLTIEGATKGLRGCIEADFCSYDGASEYVWVHEMARYQVGEGLSASDKRSLGIQKAYEQLADNPYLAGFFDRYGEAFNMQSKREPKHAEESPFDGPSQDPPEPHRSQQQQQQHHQQHQHHQQQQQRADETGTLDAAAVSVALIGWERERHKAARGISPSNPTVIDLAGLGVTLVELRAAYDDAVADRDANTDATPVNAGFVRTFVEKRRRPPKPKRDDWGRSPEGISRRASELGVAARPGESFDSLRERVQAVERRANGHGAPA